MTDSQEKTNADVINGVSVSDVVSNPTKYGFQWKYGPLAKEPNGPAAKVVLRENAPYIAILDESEEIAAQAIAAFVAAFGARRFVSYGNGTSHKVKTQALARPMIVADRNVSNDEIKRQIVIRVLLGQIVRGPQTRATFYTLPDDSTTTDKEVAKKAWAEHKAKLAGPSDDDKARELIETLTEMGISVADAIAKAKAKYPSAHFGTTDRLAEAWKQQIEDETA